MAAITINNLVGFETGGTHELDSVTGSPVVEAGGRTGGWHIRITAAADAFTINCFDFISDAGDKQALGFYFKVISTDTIGDRVLLRARESSTGFLLINAVRVDADKFTLKLRDVLGSDVDTGTTEYDDDVWHRFELIFDHLDSGAAKVFINGVEELSVTSTDFNAGGTFDNYFFGGGATNTDVQFDDIYIASGLTDESDLLGDFEVFAYQNSVASATPSHGAIGGSGDDSELGNWDQAGETPGNDTNNAGYSGSGALEGSVDLAAFGAEIDGDSNIRGMKGIWRGDRGGGSSAVTSIAIGNSGDGDTLGHTDIVVLLNGTILNYVLVTSTDLPIKAENITQGVYKAAGGYDWDLREMWAMILHVPGGGAGVSIAPTPGTIATAGQPVTITLQTNIDPTPSTIATAGQAVTVDPITAIDPATGVIGTAGQPVTMTLETVETPAPGVIATAGQPVNISAELIMPVIPGEIALSGLPVDLSLETQIGPALGVIAIAGLPVSMLVATSLTPATAIIGTVGQPVSVVPDLVVVPAPAVIAMAGLPVDIVLETILAPGLAAIALAGLPVDMILETAIQPAPAVIGLVGQPVSLAIETIITPGAAVIATSGFGVTMVLETAMSIVTGVIATVGQAVVVALGGVISPAFGIIAMSGRPVSLVPEVIANVRHWRRRIIRRRLARRSRR